MQSTTTPPRPRTTFSPVCLAVLLCGVIQAQVTDPAITAWKVNHTNARGSSPDPTLHAAVSLIPADVTRVRYTATDGYVEATGIPSYPIGAFPHSPNPVTNQSWRFRIPRAPQANTGPFTPTQLGPIGVFVNGVVVFNARDGRSYGGLGVWNQNAVVAEADGFDPTFGHPAMGGEYHHHQRPPSLLAQRCDDGRHHSAIIGFAFDGFPIYGPYAFANVDGSGGARRMRSSYRLRNLTTRPDGPDVSAQYPLGLYLEDFELVPMSGDLDAHNGRFAVTPEYPQGTYAYFSTIDDQGNNAYPYMIGPTYYGVLVNANTNRSVVIPGSAVSFAGSGWACPYGSGCPVAQPLGLAFTGLPNLGVTLHIDLSNGPATAPGFVILGLQNTAPYPIDLTGIGMPSCRLYQSPDLLLRISFSGGNARLSLAIPNDQALWGSTLDAQGVAMDASANEAGISSSNGGHIEVRG